MSGPYNYVPSAGFGQQVAAPLIHAVANQWAAGPAPPPSYSHNSSVDWDNMPTISPSSSMHTSPVNWDTMLPMLQLRGNLDPQNPRILYESTVGPASTLSWSQLLILLQAGCNPRFSGTLINARTQVIHGGFGDSLSLIGGFPYVVRDALPNAKDIMRARNGGSNATVEATLGTYIITPSARSWNGVLHNLYLVAPTPYEQAALAHSVYQALVIGFGKLLAVNRLHSEEVAMVAVMADMGCQDRPLYGPLGKNGGRNMAVCPQIFVGSNTSGVPQDSYKPGVLVSAFVLMAQTIVASRPLQ